MNHVPSSGHPIIGVSKVARSPASDDRRHFQRFEGSGLIAGIATQLLDVDDVSITGLRVAGLELPCGQVVRVKLIPRIGTKLAVNDAVLADAEVVAATNGYCRLRFSQVRYGLAKLLIRYISDRAGIAPFIVK